MSKDNKIAGTYEVSPAAGYAGDVAPTTAWKILSENKDAVLIDVRTRAEWNYVGLPDLTPGQEAGAARMAGLSEHAAEPGIRVHASGAIADKDTPLLFLCRSGARSAAAAKAMTAAGYSTCLNVSDGFEGPMDAQAKRGAEGDGRRRDFRGDKLEQIQSPTSAVTTQRSIKRLWRGPTWKKLRAEGT